MYLAWLGCNYKQKVKSDNHKDVDENNNEKNAADDSADEAQCDVEEASKESDGKDSGEGPSLIPFI